MGNVMLIPARRQVGSNARKQEEEKPKLRVAAYCRVSTDSDEQATSYEAQVEHYTEYIQKNPDWEFAGIYADDGISGTNTKKREEFNRMIDDCKAGNIDMIITKSISRFARNTLDCLKYIRQLKDMNIPVLFEKEAINTMDAKGEVLITIMASLAQQESQSLSQNVKMGLQYRYQQGKVQINHNRFLGYTKDADGNLIIDPEQAETVKRIYREYLEGLSMDKIAAGLERDGILTGAGGKKWHTSTINKILRNEKYIGDALLQKTYTTDFLNKTRVKNNGLVPQYYVEGNHEAIIPKDIYLQVQEELVRRRVVKTSANGKKRSYSCNHCFSQIIICGECSEMFRRLHWNNRGVKSIVWRCISRLESTGLECHARTINELVLQDTVVKAINQMLSDKSNYQAQLQLNIAAVIRASQATAIDSIDEKLMALQQELIQKANSKEDYDEIADEIFRLRELRQKTTVDTAARDEQIKRINDLQDYISQQTTLLTEFDEALVRRWIKQITVWDDHITVELKYRLTGIGVPFPINIPSLKALSMVIEDSSISPLFLSSSSKSICVVISLEDNCSIPLRIIATLSGSVPSSITTELLRILKLAAIIKALLLAVSNKISTSPGESTYLFSSLFSRSTLLTTSISLELEALFCSAII